MNGYCIRSTEPRAYVLEGTSIGHGIERHRPCCCSGVTLSGRQTSFIWPLWPASFHLFVSVRDAVSFVRCYWPSCSLTFQTGEVLRPLPLAALHAFCASADSPYMIAARTLSFHFARLSMRQRSLFMLRVDEGGNHSQMCQQIFQSSPPGNHT